MKNRRARLKILTISCFLLAGFFGLAGGAEAASYYVSPTGSNSNIGTEAYPWKTVAHSVTHLSAGDTLYLRDGTFYEGKIDISVSGTEAQPITIKNYPGENVTIDGGITDFRSVNNSDWEVYDADKSIYRSVNTYAGTNGVEGFFEYNNTLYRLVPYERYEDLSTNNEAYVEDNDIYVGPGLRVLSDNKIYIRLKPTQIAIAEGYNIPSSLDPRQVKLYLFSDHELVFLNNVSYINIEGIDLLYQGNIIYYENGTHHITFKDSNIRGGQYTLEIRASTHDLTFDGITADYAFPPWVTWSDVKEGRQPAHALQGCTLLFNSAAHDVEIKNCIFNNAFDATDLINASYDVHIHHNRFYNNRDDVITLGTSSYNLEINNNEMINVFVGVSRDKTAAPAVIGTKYIHHNVIDASKAMLKNRGNGVDNYTKVYDQPFGSHSIDGSPADPWKIYNNTLKFGPQYNELGCGVVYSIGNFDISCPQEVYNNILVQVGNHWLTKHARVSDASQIFDGNLYWRTPNPTTWFFAYYWANGTSKHFYSLQEFLGSDHYQLTKSYYPSGWEASGIQADPQLDSEYHPNSNGPAATGAINLSSKGWPGADDAPYRGALAPRDTTPPAVPSGLAVA